MRTLRFLLYLFSLFFIVGFFSCRESSKEPVKSGDNEQKSFVIVNQSFSLDTGDAEATSTTLKKIDNIAVVDTIYVNLVKALFSSSRYELALPHLLKFKETLSGKSGKMDAWLYYSLGQAYNYTAAYDSAVVSLKLAIDFYLKAGLQSGIAPVYNEIASAYSYLGKFPQSAEYRFMALKLYESLGDSSSAYKVKLDIGDNFFDQEQFEKAIELYTSALDFFERTGDSLNQSSAHVCLASGYQQIHDFPHAIVHAQQSLQIQRKLQSEEGLAESLNAVAVAYMRNKEFLKAISYLREAYEIVERKKDLRDLPPMLHNIAVCQAETGKLDSAETTLKKSIEIAEKSGQRYGITNTYLSLVKLSMRQNNYKAATEYLITVMKLKDTLHTEEQTRTINELNVRYETEKKVEEIKNLGQSRKLDQVRKQYLQTGIILLVLLGIMVVAWLMTRNRKNKLLYEAMNRLHEQQMIAMKRELELNRERLDDFTQSLIGKTTMIEELESKLNATSSPQSQSSEQFRVVTEELSKMKLVTETDWNQFRHYFDSVYPGLTAKVMAGFETITAAELRLFQLIKMDIGNKEISSMLAISPDSVKKTRYRLKKKLLLSEEENLDDFIAAFH